MINRRQTRPVRVGPVTIGGSALIVIQSMTTTRPSDLRASVAQIEALARAGCELVRLATPSIEEARALGPLREALTARAIRVPLVADVHFNPRAAYEAARHAEKVRINPGNFARSVDDARRRLPPLLDRLREHGGALRIGVNHGSLAPVVAERFGHGPRGMVASAMEYLQLCREAGFEQIVVALKASNPQVMVAANRLLIERMRTEGMDYPVHLGVTEAGAGEEGALRSAVGIGALLLEGIGDTIRVSLTGDPVREIDACRRLLAAVAAEALEDGAAPQGAAAPQDSVAPAEGAVAGPRSEPARWLGLAVGGEQPPRVEVWLPCEPAQAGGLGAAAARIEQLTSRAEQPAESWLLWDRCLGDAFGSDEQGAAPDPTAWTTAVPMLRTRGRARAQQPPFWLAWPAGVLGSLPLALAAAVDGLHLLCSANAPGTGDPVIADLQRLSVLAPALAVRWQLPVGERASLAATGARARALLDATRAAGFDTPAFSWGGLGRAALGRALTAALGGAPSGASRVAPSGAPSVAPAGAPSGAGPSATLQHRRTRPLMVPWLGTNPTEAAVGLGPLLLDGQIDGLIASPAHLQTAYDLLHVSRRRVERVDFISCPGCGRLAYDLEGTVRRLRRKLGHLRSVKIAVMGCAVNGPGEMADADFGYVGSVAGKVDLYVGRERRHRALDPEKADALLIELVRERGLWRDPPRQAGDREGE